MSLFSKINDAVQVLFGKKCLHTNTPTPPIDPREDMYLSELDRDLVINEVINNSSPSVYSFFGGAGDFNLPARTYRENYDAYEFMDTADCSAILDIHAASAVQNSAYMNFRPYKLIIEPKKTMDKNKFNALKIFLELSEQKSKLFDVLYGVARDGFKYGASYEKAKFGRISEGETIIGFQSLETPNVYPLYNNSDELTSYYYRDPGIDYYNQDRFLNQQKTKENPATTEDKLFSESVIFPFFNSSRSYEKVGKSILQPVIDAFTCLHISQSKLLSQRITHSTRQILHKFETNGVMTSQLEKDINLLKKYNQRYKMIKRIDAKFVQAQQNIDTGSDIISFMKDGKGGAEVVKTDADIRSSRDIDLWRYIIYSTTHTPTSHIIDSVLGGGNRDAVAEQDKMLEAIISKSRKKIEYDFLTKYYQTLIDLFFQKIGAFEMFYISFEWLPISNIDALRREKVHQIRQMIAKSYRLDLDIPDDYTYKHILKMSDDDIKALKKLPKPDPLFYKQKETPADAKGENTTSPNTTVNPKKPKEMLQNMSELVKYVIDNQNHLSESDIKLVEEHVDMLSEMIEKGANNA